MGIFKRHIQLRNNIFRTMLILVLGLFVADIACLFGPKVSWLLLLPSVGALSCIGFCLALSGILNGLQKGKDDHYYVSSSFAFLLLVISYLPVGLYIYCCGDMSVLESLEGCLIYLTAGNLVLPLIFFVFICYLYWLEIILLFRNSEQYRNCVKFKRQNEQ